MFSSWFSYFTDVHLATGPDSETLHGSLDRCAGFFDHVCQTTALSLETQFYHNEIPYADYFFLNLNAVEIV